MGQLSPDPGVEFDLDPDDVHLNHGSFGAAPRSVLAEQEALRSRIDSGYHRFYAEELFERQDESRRAIATWLGADTDGFVLAANATTSVWAALQVLDLRAGERLVTSTHEYAATEAMLMVLEQRGVVVCRVRLSGTDEEIVGQLLGAVDDSTRCVLVSHVSSPWSELFPVHLVHDGLRGSEVQLVVDGAHGPGLVHAPLSTLPGAWYAATLHKWGYFPRGCGALTVPEPFWDVAQPAIPSLGARDQSLAVRFGWAGTRDPSPQLMGLSMVAFHDHAVRHGWFANASELARLCRAELLERFASLVPVGSGAVEPMTTYRVDSDVPVQQIREGLRVRGVWTWIGPDPDHPGSALLRVSIAVYNRRADVDRLVQSLDEILGGASC